MVKRKVGRPTDYKKTYPKLLEKILTNGGYNVTFCKKVGISEPCFYDWVKKHPEFSKALGIGKAAAKADFLDKVTEAAWDGNKRVNNGLISLLAVNCFGMVTGKEKVELAEEDGKPVFTVEVINK